MNITTDTTLGATRQAIDLATHHGYQPSAAMTDAIAALDLVQNIDQPEPAPLHVLAGKLGAKSKPGEVADLLAAHADHATRSAEFAKSRGIMAELVARRVLAAAAGWPDHAGILSALGGGLLSAAERFTTATRGLPADLDADALLRAGHEAVASFEAATAAKGELDGIRVAVDTVQSLASPTRPTLAENLCRFWTPAGPDQFREALRLVQHHKGRLSPWRELYDHGTPAWRDVTEARALATQLDQPQALTRAERRALVQL